MRARIVPTVAACLVATGLIGAAGAAESGGTMVTLQQCPPAVQQTLQRESRDGTIGEIEAVESAGGPVFLAVVKQGGREYDLEVRGSGELVMKGLSILEEGPVKPAELPAPVRATFEREAQGGTVGATITRHNPQLANGPQTANRMFSGTVTVGGLDYHVEVREDGVLLVKARMAKADPPRKP